jgi:hypothetical protein
VEIVDPHSEPSAIFRNRTFSGLLRLPNHSAMLAGMETAARRIWCASPNISR